jgi:hypothetical protein
MSQKEMEEKEMSKRPQIRKKWPQRKAAVKQRIRRQSKLLIDWRTR